MAINQQGLAQQTRITRKPFFVGLNTVDRIHPPYSLTNIDIVKRDIRNHFATPMGARVMLPNFGTRIYEYLFNPFDEYTENIIIEDATRVVNSDPRVELIDITISQSDHALNITMELLFQPSAIRDSLFVSFSKADRESF